MAKDRSQNLSELLSAYLDGELDEATTAKVVAHLERDANARLLLRELRETRSMLQGLPRESAPADFAESVVAAMSHPPVRLGAGLVPFARLRRSFCWSEPPDLGFTGKLIAYR